MNLPLISLFYSYKKMASRLPSYLPNVRLDKTNHSENLGRYHDYYSKAIILSNAKLSRMNSNYSPPILKISFKKKRMR